MIHEIPIATTLEACVFLKIVFAGWNKFVYKSRNKRRENQLIKTNFLCTSINFILGLLNYNLRSLNPLSIFILKNPFLVLNLK